MASNVFKTRQKITHVSISTYIIRPCNFPHGNPLIRDFLLEPINALNFSLNLSRGVHRRKAIFVFLPPIVKTDSGTTASRKRRHFHAVVRNLTHPPVGRCAAARPRGPRPALRLDAGFSSLARVFHRFAPGFGPNYPSCRKECTSSLLSRFHGRIFSTSPRGHVTLRVCLVRTAAPIVLESPRSKVSLTIAITKNIHV